MKSIPCYTKILTLGSRFTENALIGEVIIQEKVDGSQFKFGINEDKELIFASKGVNLHPIEAEKGIQNVPSIFNPAVKYLLSIKEKLLTLEKDTYFYAETLRKPKHNVLKYERVPRNNIVLFDVVIGSSFANRKKLQEIADYLEIDLIPELWRGDLIEYLKNKNDKGYSISVDFLKRLIETTYSFLGSELIEGVVIKNYKQTILLGGQIFPLFTKYVRESFKERHDTEWKIKNPKDSLQDFIKGFKNENRWKKAILHLKEKELLSDSPKDIGLLINEIKEDILLEETENIKQYLFNKFKEDILRNSIMGFPEWYKEQLLNNLKGE